MACSFAATAGSCNAAERELYRYYQPIDLIEPPATLAKPAAPKPSHDTALTAFAQLGALRLQAKRGIITLASRSVEYIIAEAGQTISLQDETRHGPDDELWHGVGQLHSKQHIAQLFLHHLSKSPNQYVVIPNVDEDETFDDIRREKNDKFAKFLSAFPLVTPSKVIIGFYLIADTKPRPDGLSDVEIEFMKDMAQTVMDHLEVARMKKKGARAERMVKALGLFVEGQPSLRNWWVGAEKERRSVVQSVARSTLLSVDELATHLFGTPEAPGNLAGLGNHRSSMFSKNNENSPDSSVTHDPISERLGSVTSSDHRPSLTDQERYSSYNTAITTPTPTTTTTDESMFDSRRRMSLYPPEELPMSPRDSADDGRSLQEAVLSSRLKDIFARAANLTREAIQIDGAIIYDASVSSFGASAQEKGDEKAPGGFTYTAEGATSGSEEELRRVATNGSAVENPAPVQICEPQAKTTEKGCNILGYSTRKRATIYGHSPPEEFQSMPEKFLRSLLKKYPHGKTYNFGADGTVSSGESDSNVSHSDATQDVKKDGHDNGHKHRKRRTMSRETEAKIITKAFPGARSVVFYPLWDSGRERWFAGSFIWTTSACRVLCPSEELPYMASFSNSIMAEVARLSAQLSSQMKTDFVSSISHELRSPLHGVLAAVELLQESDMTVMQADLITTINSCGKTLLDTINHVLDFSKVNRKQKNNRAKGRPRKANGTTGPNKSEEAPPEDDSENLSILTEEVIESVYAGSSLGRKLWNSGPGHHRTVSVGASSISVIVDAEWRRDWYYEVDAGAWRRILMNIFGNSMKYTTEGFVKVVLKSEDDALSKDGKNISAISLTVTDSGKGISQEFLRTHLYTPFAQEDNLSVGTGLGLSIVRQIVHDLGGSIHFTSDGPGTGTEAKVILPLKSSIRPVLTADDEKSAQIFSEVKHKTTSMQACLVSFDAFPDLTEEPTGILSPASQAKISLKSSVSAMMKDWFGMDVVSTSNLNMGAADIHIISEDSLTGRTKIWNDIEKYGKQPREKNATKIIMILCVTYPSDSIVIDKEGFRVFYVQQPYGPHKIAAALHRALLEPPSNVNYKAELNATISAAPHTADSELHRPPLVREHAVSSESVASEVSTLADTPSSTRNPISIDGTSEERPTRVLIVEDNEINLKLLVTYMRKLNLPHSTAVNGLEALNQFQETHGAFDCILMDISMPIMDGLTSSRKIRQHENEHSLRPPAIIALTGAASMSARQEAFSAGIDLFLTKPVPLKKLKGILEDLRRDGREGLIESR